jgi:hypothetical protein
MIFGRSSRAALLPGDGNPLAARPSPEARKTAKTIPGVINKNRQDAFVILDVPPDTAGNISPVIGQSQPSQNLERIAFPADSC